MRNVALSVNFRREKYFYNRNDSCVVTIIDGASVASKWKLRIQQSNINFISAEIESENENSIE